MAPLPGRGTKFIFPFREMLHLISFEFLKIDESLHFDFIMEIIIKNEKELDGVVEQLLTFAEGRKKFFLKGDLGAGKTTLVKAFCRKHEVADNVSSPTYSLINEYVFHASGKEKRIYHIDLYRLKDIDEALNIGIEDYLYNDDYCFVVWADVILPIAPEGVVLIEIETQADSSRKILFL